MIFVHSSGSLRKTESFLKRISRVDILSVLDACGQEGVDALAANTPMESSLAAQSWSFETKEQNGRYSIVWTNSDVENGFPVVIMLQYGYSTGIGGYVQGRDFINPAMKPIFDKIADKVWKAVTSA